MSDVSDAVESMNEAAAKIRELRQENERLGIDLRAWKILAESAEVDIERLRRHHGGQSGCAVCGWNL